MSDRPELVEASRMSTPAPQRLAHAIRFLAIDAIVRAGEGHQGVPLGSRIA